MWCCRKRDYEVREDGDNVVDEKPVQDDAYEPVEAPVTVCITQATENAPLTSLPGKTAATENQSAETTKENGEVSREASSANTDNHTKTATEIREKNSKYMSQMSMCSTLSIREEINRSREQFFYSNSLNDPLLQDQSPTSKRLSTTDEKFLEYQRRIRARRLAEEEVMSAEQMHVAVSRLEAVAARLESLAVAGVGGGSHGSGSVSARSGGSSAPGMS